MSFIDFADEIKSPWVAQKQTQIGGRNSQPVICNNFGHSFTWPQRDTHSVSVIWRPPSSQLGELGLPLHTSHAIDIVVRSYLNSGHSIGRR
jgi:hypothetical protein